MTPRTPRRISAIRGALVVAAIACLTATGTSVASAGPRSAHVGIDLDAPVITRDEVLVDAPVRCIWKVQTDVEQWPTWQPDVTSVDKITPGRLKVGSQWRWLTGGLDITSTVKEVKPNRRTVWGGPANGITAVHVWTFTPTRHGVLVHTEESWTGAPVDANPVQAQAALDGSLRAWLLNLKSEVDTKNNNGRCRHGGH